MTTTRFVIPSRMPGRKMIVIEEDLLEAASDDLACARMTRDFLAEVEAIRWTSRFPPTSLDEPDEINLAVGRG